MPTASTSRRPLSLGRRGAVVVAVVLAGGASAGCGSEKVPIEAPALSAADSAACADLLDALPDTVAGALRRPVHPDDAPGAAWGDPAIVLTCGAEAPAGYAPASPCIAVRGVGWFAPEDSLEELGSDVRLTALTVRPRVSLLVPPEHRGSDQVLATLARPLKQALAAGGEDCL